MTWTIDHPTSTTQEDIVKRGCNGRRAPLLHLIARQLELGERGHGIVPLAHGWARVDGARVGPPAGIKAASVRSELNQMMKRGSIEFEDLGGRDYNVRITEKGRAVLAGEASDG